MKIRIFIYWLNAENFLQIIYCVLQVEDEDEWEEGAQEIGIVGNEVDELGPTAREIEGRRRGTNLWE